MKRPSVTLEGRRRAAASLTSIAVFALGFALVAAVVVRGRLVSSEFYLAALDEVDAYDRTYSEVLADPEFAAVTERLIGELGLTPEASRRVRVLSTSALRWTLPPPRLRVGVEAFVDQVMGYVSGEQGGLDADIEISDIVLRVLETVLAQVGATLAEAAETVATSVVEYEHAIAEFADQLAVGTVPGEVPVLAGGAFEAQQVIDVLLRQLGERADPRLARQIRGAVLAGSQRDALVAAGSAFVAEHATRIAEELRGDALGARYVDVLSQLAERAGVREGEIESSLGSIRSASSWFGPPTGVLGGALMLVAAVVLVWLHQFDLRRACRALAACGLASAVAVGAGWLVASAVVDPPLAAATGTGPDSWDLPPGLRGVLDDFEVVLAADLEDVVRRLLLVPALVGAGFAAVSAVPLLPRIGVRGLAFGGAGSALALGWVVWLVPTQPGFTAQRLCNGHAELCDRPYDDVVHATSHNAMSSADLFVWPEHDRDLRGQLDSGVRALMLDTYYWTPLVSGDQLASADPVLSAPLAQQVLGILEGRREARGGVYLCHSHCSLGAKPLVDGLRQVRSFLEDNPDEVVTLIIQDAITRPDTVDAFERAELLPHVYTHDDGGRRDPDGDGGDDGGGGRWPTLGQLIDSGRRLVVFSEVHGPPPDWYHKAFDHIQDTPYRFRSAAEFSCAPNRGPRNAPLFLMNHWVQRIAPDRATAAEVNRHDVIVERALRCQARRGQLPNFLAVNFSSIGDLIAAVDTLNGVRSP